MNKEDFFIIIVIFPKKGLKRLGIVLDGMDE
jgi:hypothetical protein